MIDSIKIKNFTCFDDYAYEIKFSKLTIIVGPNNSGKSAIFKAMNLIRSFPGNKIRGEPMWTTGYYDLQDEESTHYNHDLMNEIEIILKYRNDPAPIEATFGYQNSTYTNRKYVESDNTYQLESDEHFRKASTILFLSANRGQIPFRLQVGRISEDALQPIIPTCENIIQFLVEKHSQKDENWAEFERWLKEIDKKSESLLTTLKGVYSSLITTRNDGKNIIKVNLSLQGSGIQSLISIIAALTLSPKNSTIIIEEPEIFLNGGTIEKLVDLFNYSVEHLEKQVIITTHSWEVLLQYISDIGSGTSRGESHQKITRSNFKLVLCTENLGKNKIQEYDLQNKKFSDVRSDFKTLLG